MTNNDSEPLRERITRQSEETLGRLAQDLLTNPTVTSAISRVFEAREKASHAQEAAMGALNLPSAADLERLTRRVRSVSQRLEGIEDSLERVAERIEKAATRVSDRKIDTRLSDIESQLSKLSRDVHDVATQVNTDPAPQPREQERLAVGETLKPSKSVASRTRATSAPKKPAKKS